MDLDAFDAMLGEYFADEADRADEKPTIDDYPIHLPHCPGCGAPAISPQYVGPAFFRCTFCRRVYDFARHLSYGF